MRMVLVWTQGRGLVGNLRQFLNSRVSGALAGILSWAYDWIGKDYESRPYRGQRDRLLSTVTVALLLLVVAVLAGLTMAPP